MKNGADPSFEIRVRTVKAVIMNGESVADVAETLNYRFRQYTNG
jgi:hypothetical protein